MVFKLFLLEKIHLKPNKYFGFIIKTLLRIADVSNGIFQNFLLAARTPFIYDITFVSNICRVSCVITFR